MMRTRARSQADDYSPRVWKHLSRLRGTEKTYPNRWVIHFCGQNEFQDFLHWGEIKSSRKKKVAEKMVSAKPNPDRPPTRWMGHTNRDRTRRHHIIFRNIWSDIRTNMGTNHRKPESLGATICISRTYSSDILYWIWSMDMSCSLVLSIIRSM